MDYASPCAVFDPILVQIGPVAIRWYALAYIAGLLGGMYYMQRLAKWPPAVVEGRDVDDFLVWAVIGVVLGGRIGYVLFYNLDIYIAEPMRVLEVWKGGMSFHGGFLGVVVAGVIFVRRRGLDALAFGDLLGCAAPIGLFLGRITNFVNGELFGRPTDVPWGVVFPCGGDAPRHPSQLYEAGLEGLVLFTVTLMLYRRESIRRRPGVVMGTFIAGYAIARTTVELFRQPDEQVGFLIFGSTMGQMLSIPMLLVGLWFVFRAKLKY